MSAPVEARDVEKTGISVDDLLKREGKNSSGALARPIDVAAIGLKFDIGVYLAGKGVKGEKFAEGKDSSGESARPIDVAAREGHAALWEILAGVDGEDDPEEMFRSRGGRRRTRR